MEVDYWNPNRDLRPRTSAPRERWSTVALGVAGTILLHGLILQSALLGSGAHRVRPPEVDGMGASRIESPAAPTETLLLIELPDVSVKPTFLIEELASAGQVKAASVDILVSSDSMPHVEIAQDVLTELQAADAAISDADPGVRAALFGRYTGQIDARIERAWRRPRTAVNGLSSDAYFKCQVRIVQDAHGSVDEVQIIDCDNDSVWRQSLVAAIFSASPLPAPPSPSVFTRTLTMTFRSAQYTPGAATDDYEIASR